MALSFANIWNSQYGTISLKTLGSVVPEFKMSNRKLWPVRRGRVILRRNLMKLKFHEYEYKNTAGAFFSTPTEKLERTVTETRIENVETQRTATYNWPGGLYDRDTTPF